MYKVSKTIDFCYGHRLLNYDGKCRHLHGHNARAEIELNSSKLDERGMVFDFSDIKKAVKSWIDDNLDHVMILNEKDDIIPMLQDAGERYLAVPANPTAEFISKLIYDHVKSLDFPVVSVKVWETPDSFAEYSE